MGTYPVVRRRPRRVRPRVATPPRQTFSQPALVVVSDQELQIDDDLEVQRIIRWNQDADCRGDPADAATFECIADLDDLTAVIALNDESAVAGVVRALQSANPRVAIVVAANEVLIEESDGLLTQVTQADALCDAIADEVERLESLKRVRALREFADGAEVLPILIHRDPDPDALASALATRILLKRSAMHAPIVTLDEMTRPENRRMAELLDIQVTQVSLDELLRFERLICTDMQPTEIVRQNPHPRVAVIDHHPAEHELQTVYMDIRPGCGATATILTEYLRAIETRFGERLATALVYGIRTDTDALSRGVSAADVEAYTFLLERADPALLMRIERPAYSVESARAYGDALASIILHNDLAVSCLGELNTADSHMLADLADHCLAIEEATWAAAAAIVEGKLVITLRHLGNEPGAGALARALAQQFKGTGGGHATMARVVLPLDAEWGALKDAPLEKACPLLIEKVERALEQLR